LLLCKHITRKCSLPLLLLVTTLTAWSGETSRAKRKTKSQHRGRDQDLPEPARPVAGRHRTPHGAVAMLSFTRGERSYCSVARNARQNCRGDGYFTRRLFPGHGNAAGPRNAEDARRAFAGRNPVSGGDQTLQQHLVGWRQAAGAGDDSQDGHYVAAASPQTGRAQTDGVKRSRFVKTKGQALCLSFFFFVANAGNKLSPQHERARDHVVQCLFALRNPGKDVTNPQWNQARYDPRKVATCGSPKTHGGAVQIGHKEVQDFFARGRLPGRTLERGIVKPFTDQSEQYN